MWDRELGEEGEQFRSKQGDHEYKTGPYYLG